LRATPSGQAIPIEERDPLEVTRVLDRPVAPVGAEAVNPAFDITPAELVSAFFTEAGVLEPPYEESIARVVRPRIT
jgi:methylthioribose-1-phosphate isomerase